MSTGLVLPYMLGNRCHFLFHKHVFAVFFSTKKKIGEEDAEFYFFSFDSFSDIACNFA